MLTEKKELVGDLTAKLNKLTIKVDRPQLSSEDIKKLEAAMRNNKMSE